MAKEKVKNPTIEQLKKRKKLGSILLAILTFSVVLSLLVVIYNLLTGEGLNTSLLVAAFGCFMVAIPIYLGKKKIDMELKNIGIN